MASTALSAKAVGSIVKLNVNGSPRDFIVVHQGKPGSMYDESCNGTWLLMKDIYENRQWHSSNVNDYQNSTIHSYLNSTFLGLFDPEIQAVIKQVKIPYRKGSGTSKTVTSGANGLSAKIFLLSSTEVSFNHNYMPTNEGAELSYFAGCADSGSDNKRVAYLNSSATNWWLRSPNTNTTPTTPCTWAPMATGTTTTAPTRTGCAPLWYFPLLSLSLTMGRLRPTRLGYHQHKWRIRVISGRRALPSHPLQRQRFRRGHPHHHRKGRRRGEKDP